MVRAVIIRPRSDNAGSATTLDSVSYDGITINFDDNKTSDEFYNGHTDESITSAFSPSYQSGLTWMLINGSWPSDAAASNGVDGINTLSLKGLDLTTRYIPVTFTPGDRIEDFMNMHWAGHGDNVGTLADNFEELKLVSIASGGWGQPDVYGTQFSFDFLTGAVSYSVTNNPPLGNTGWHKIDITDNYLYACGQGDGVFNGELSKYLWGVLGTPVSFAIQIKPKASSGGGDTTAPTISEVTAISTYTNDTTPSYTFTTDEAGTLTTTISQGFSGGSSVSITGTGNQTVTFATLPEETYSGQTITLTDADGNASTLTIPTFTIDTTNPVITLNGSATTELTVGDTFTDPVTATDNSGTVDITANITYGGNFNNTNTAGSYTRTYDVTDSAGNQAPQKTRNINVNAASTTIVITTTTFSADENQTSVGTIGTTGGDGSAKTYEITGGDDINNFELDSSTGVLTFKDGNEPDFETKTSYTIIVKVADTAYTNTATITVNIDNVQEGLGTTLPTISGTASEGGTLTASTTGISDPDNITSGFSYQWKRGASNIGTNSSTYTVASADVGTTITVTVTYQDGKGDQQTLTSVGTTISSIDDKIYFWTEYFENASNNIPADSTLIHYAIYNTTKVSGVQFTYNVAGTTAVADVDYSIVDNSNNNTAVYKKEWLQIINTTTSESYKSMLFWGNVNQTLNGMVTGTFAIVKGNVTLDSVLGITNHLSENIDPSTDNVILAEPQNPPTIENPGGRILGDLNFDASLNNTDADIMSAYLLNDTDISFNTYDSNGVEITPKKTAQEIIDEMMGGEWLEHVDINANGHVDVGDLVRILSKIADPTFNMSSGL